VKSLYAALPMVHPSIVIRCSDPVVNPDEIGHFVTMTRTDPARPPNRFSDGSYPTAADSIGAGIRYSV